MLEFIIISVISLLSFFVLAYIWNYCAESYVYRKHWLHLPGSDFMILITEGKFMPTLAFKHLSFIWLHKKICRTIRDGYVFFRPAVYSTNILLSNLHYENCYLSDIEQIPRNDDGTRNTEGYVSLIELDPRNDSVKSSLLYIPELLTYDWNDISDPQYAHIREEIAREVTGIKKQ